MKGWKKSLVLAAALIPALAVAASWWNNDWKYRKEIGFDMSPAGADVAATTQDDLMLVRLSLANFSYFNDTKADGSDFRLIAGDDKTPLKFHIESYDSVLDVALVWVAVVVTFGVRGSQGAFLAGLAFSLIPAAFSIWSSATWIGYLPSVLFGLGAVGLAKEPRGFLAPMEDKLADLWANRPRSGTGRHAAPATASPVAVGASSAEGGAR